MMKNVTLVNAPYYLRGRTSFKYIEGYTIPLGIMSIAAVIQRDHPDVDIRIIDGMAINLPPGDLLNAILKESPEIVGIRSFTYNINDALLLAKWIKIRNPDIKIAIGGVHATQLPLEVIRNSAVDLVFRGESEYAFRDFIAGKPYRDIDGLVYKNPDGTIKMNPNMGLIDDLDDLPMPAYDLVDMKKYFPVAGQCHRFPASTVIASRGCPGRCIFCSSSVSGKKIRKRSAENIFKEMLFLMEHYGVKEIVFGDDVFTSDKERVFELCRLIKQNNVDILWDCSTRVQFVNEEMLNAMKGAGCSEISFGVESGDEYILKAIKKGQTLSQVIDKVNMVKKAGLESKCSFILGFPQDTMETMQKTIDFAIELDPHIVSFYIACPYPGTVMYDWAAENDNLLTKNWSYYDQSHHIMKIPNAASEQIDSMFKKAYASFYHRPRFILKRLRMIRSLYDLKNAFKAAWMTLNVHAFPETDFEAVQDRVEGQYMKAEKSTGAVH